MLQMTLLVALSFMHGLVPSDFPERAVLSGASFTGVLVFLVSRRAFRLPAFTLLTRGEFRCTN